MAEAGLHKYEFNVQMSCTGCSGAVERVLKKKEGVTDYKVNLETQLVEVTGSAPYEVVLETIKKTGKTVVSGKTVS